MMMGVSVVMGLRVMMPMVMMVSVIVVPVMMGWSMMPRTMMTRSVMGWSMMTRSVMGRNERRRWRPVVMRSMVMVSMMMMVRRRRVPPTSAAHCQCQRNDSSLPHIAILNNTPKNIHLLAKLISTSVTVTTFFFKTIVGMA